MKLISKKSYCILGGWTLLLLFLGVFFYQKMIVPKYGGNCVETMIVQGEKRVPISDGTHIKQDFLTKEQIQGIIVYFSSKKSESLNGIVDVSIQDDQQNTLAVKTIDLKDSPNGGATQVIFDNLVNTEKGNTYSLNITGISGIDENHEIVLLSNELSRKGFSLYKNDVAKDVNLSFSMVLAKTNSFLRVIYVLGFCFVFLLSFILWILFVKRINSVPYIYLGLVIGFGIIYMFIMKPNAIPDEAAHYSNAYARSNQLMHLTKEELDPVDGGDIISIPSSIESYRLLCESLKGDRNDVSTNQNRPQLIQVPFYLHFMAAFGITVGRVLHFNNIWIFYMGRLFNFAFFVLCTFFAVKKIPFGKMALVSICLFPMTLHLAASYSYDAIINGASFLFISYVLYLVYQKESICIKDVIVPALTGMIVVGSKSGAYIPIVLLILFIPYVKLGNKKKYLIGCTSMLVIWMIWFISQTLSVAKGAITNNSNYIEWAGENGYTAKMVLANPIHSMYVLINSFWELSDDWIVNIIGKDLGWFNIPMMSCLVFAFAILVILGSIKVKYNDLYEVTIPQKLLMGSICLICVLLVMGGMWIGWTPASHDLIRGVQGRYFLPFLPFIICLLRNKVLVLEKNIDKEMLVSIFVLQTICVIKILTTTLA
ncbi:MAG: DUF2142 domain-containing protein [Hespellia sp.]|nr:DUF2142 domain-containing protein [Hespellia sp.]